jgi:transposase-like protein
MWYNGKMRKQTVDEARRCPKCGKIENQVKRGYNRSGTQRCECRECGAWYTINPKTKAYPEEIRQDAIKTYYSGVSGRGVGALFGMGKENVVRWIKKTK